MAFEHFMTPWSRAKDNGQKQNRTEQQAAVT
ncbi:hypothetical protein BSNT_10697 [Bacillus subtilis subsp. natto BEST195]|nr:hypothetical protein BSNT_10697 [Bacillus subtilis subsp. natto BEST195]